DIAGRDTRTSEKQRVERQEVTKACAPVPPVDPLLAENPDLGRRAGPGGRNDLRAVVAIEVGERHPNPALEEPRIGREAADGRPAGLVDRDSLIRAILNRRPRSIRRWAAAQHDLGTPVTVQISDGE